MSVELSTTQTNGYVIYPPPPPEDLPPYFISTPSSTSLNEGESIRLTWTAYSFASQSSRRAYIYVNGIQVKSYSSWANRQSLYYDFTKNTPATYSVKCKITDSYGSRTNTISVVVLNVPEWTVMFYLAGDKDEIVNDGWYNNGNYRSIDYLCSVNISLLFYFLRIKSMS